MKDQADALTPTLASLRSSLRDISLSLQEVHVEPNETNKSSASVQQLASGRHSSGPLNSMQIQKIISSAVELPERLKDIILLESESGLEKARGLWGSMEAVLATWDEAGIPGAKDIMNECRHVLREAQHQRR